MACSVRLRAYCRALKSNFYSYFGVIRVKPDCDVGVGAHEVPLDRYYDLIAKMATCALNAKTAVALRALDLLDSTRDEGDAAYNI